MSNHTPAPWVAEEGDVFIDSNVFGRRELLATAYEMNGEDSQHLRNAHLIAAAPDLLAVLVSLLNNKGHATLEQLQAARAAVAKAKGDAA